MRNEKINILLVDDRPENLLALEAIIEKDEYHLVKAFSGEEALKHLLKTKFALILLDVQMPGMDGFSTAKIIKAREKTKSIPILFITANNMESEHIFMGYSVGAIDYILKPVDPLILKAKVEGFVELYKLKDQLLYQTEVLEEQSNALQMKNEELLETTGKLKLSEATANVISETSIDAMIICDHDGFIIKTNPSVTPILAYTEVELIGSNIIELFSDQEAASYIAAVLKEVRNEGNIRGFEKHREIPVTKKNGSKLVAEIQLGVKFVQGIYMVAFTIKDITLQKKNEELIKHMAYHDYLTDLPNRRSMHESLTATIHRAVEENTTVGFLYLNMDRFKYINDSLGHSIGDQALIEIADRLKTTTRQGDVVARVGGDEFAIILPNTDRELSLEIAERIVESFQEPIVVNNYEFFITVSIGLSMFPFDGEDPSHVIKNADTALHRAKEQGKNNLHIFHSGMNIQTYRAFIMQNDLRKAIRNNELELYYQPKVCLETGAIVGAEALLRWNHPAWGVVSPDEFIPLAEETGQIIEIGEWVFETACRQINRWRESGITSVPLSVNFSVQQFLQKDVITRIEQIMDETNTTPKDIEIEITESLLLENKESTVETLQTLKDMGFTISIDDFGVGYSSLFYLSRLPIQTLKIDKSFIEEIANGDMKNQSIIAAILSLAKSLGLNVVAEGVETEEQLNFLLEQGCREVQGYFFSPPVPIQEFEECLLKGSYLVSTMKKHIVPVIPMHKDRLHNRTLLSSVLLAIQKQFAISSRELEVFELMLGGLSNKEISQKLFISEHTVKNHITNIFLKLGVNDRAQAMSMVYLLCINEGNRLVGF